MAHTVAKKRRRKICFGLLGIGAALFISATPAAAAEITPSDNNAYSPVFGLSSQDVLAF